MNEGKLQCSEMVFYYSFPHFFFIYMGTYIHVVYAYIPIYIFRLKGVSKVFATIEIEFLKHYKTLCM